MKPPLVSVVCLCYNHAQYVEEAIQSVLNQTYSNVQLIVVDDHSTDDSVSIIKEIISKELTIEFITLSSNLGNCRAFNTGFELAKGDFIVDLAADDILLPDRIEKGVRIFQSMDSNVGVQFSDAELIDENGAHLGYHSDRFPHDSIPQGDIYKDILSHYFINSPTMMMRRMVFERLGGYDGSLAYEDFDFWVRSSRYFKYCYSKDVLVKRRMLRSSLGRTQYKRGSDQLGSTLTVCKKAFELSTNSDEYHALKTRIKYELRQALSLAEMGIAWEYLKLWRLTDHR